MSEELRKFKAEVAAVPGFIEKESAWKKFLKGLIEKREARRRADEFRERGHQAAETFDKAGRPMGGAKDD